jgi:hypothetical protein
MDGYRKLTNIDRLDDNFKTDGLLNVEITIFPTIKELIVYNGLRSPFQSKEIFYFSL